MTDFTLLYLVRMLDTRLPSLVNKEGILSQGASSSSQTAQGLLSSKRTGTGAGADAATRSLLAGAETGVPESSSTAAKVK